MAENTTIFGTAQPLPTEGYVRGERRGELMDEEYDRLNDLERARATQKYGRSPAGESMRREREAGEAAQRVDTRMANPSPEELKARLSDSVKREVQRRGGFTHLDEDEREEETLKVAAQEAERLGMTGVAGQLASQYASKRRDRIKADLELQKLGAETKIAQRDANYGGRKTLTEVDGSTGHKYEYEVDAAGNRVTPSRVKEFSKWEPVKIGTTHDGKPIMKMQNSVTGQMEDPEYETGESVKSAISRVNQAHARFKDADAEIAKVDQIFTDDLANKWSTGWYGKKVADFGYFAALPGSKDAVALKSSLDSLQAVLGFDALAALKAKGSTLGQIAIYELQMLQATLVQLNQANSPDVLKEQLNKVKRHYKRYQDAVLYDTSTDLSYMFNGPHAAEYKEFTFQDRSGRRGIKDPETGVGTWIDPEK